MTIVSVPQQGLVLDRVNDFEHDSQSGDTTPAADVQ
jgi:hypothetical protein